MFQVSKVRKNDKEALCKITFCFHRDQYNLCWIFDQSSGHHAFADDAQVASRMNVKPGWKQPMMRPGTLPSGHQQLMVDRYGRPKGLGQVLEERGVSTHKMVREDMVAPVLSSSMTLSTSCLQLPCI